MAPASSKTWLGPVLVNGTVARAVETPDGKLVVEIWGDGGWSASSADIVWLMNRPPASPETLAALGVPIEDWPNSPSSRSPSAHPAMPTREDAIVLALAAHSGQKDKAGRPLIQHALRVAMSLHSDVEKIVGVLHDVIEDTGYTLDSLREKGYPEEVLGALDCLTKRPTESYQEFIERVKANPLARRVKVADLRDNLDTARLPKLTENDLARLSKYYDALLRLAH